jgi:hypothetical protein
LGAATLTLGIVASAHAAVFADFTPDTNAADFTWAQSSNNAAGAFATEGALTSTSIATHFSFLKGGLTALAFLPASFNLAAAVTTPTPATFNAGTGAWTQQDVSTTGTGFSFVYTGPSTVIAGHTLTQDVTVLLSGVFTDAYIQGKGTSGSVNLSSGGASSVTFNSDIIDFSSMPPGSAGFAFNLLAVSPSFGAGAGKSLNSFTANGGGNFEFVPGSLTGGGGGGGGGGIPEPATWAMMLLGAGGVGAMLRNRRRMALSAI